MPALPRLAMIALGFTLYPLSPAALGLLFLVALIWPGCQLFVNTMADDEQRTHEPPRTARSEALAPLLGRYWTCALPARCSSASAPRSTRGV